MDIDPKYRYFKMKPACIELFNQFRADVKVARDLRMGEGRAWLVEQGVPPDMAEGAVCLNTLHNDLYFTKDTRPYLGRKLRSTQSQGYYPLNQTYKVVQELKARVRAVRVPKEKDYVPSLHIGRMSFRGLYMAEVVWGTYGPYHIVKGIPKDEEYEADLDLLEELTLTEWAALVEEVQTAQKGD